MDKPSVGSFDLALRYMEGCYVNELVEHIALHPHLVLEKDYFGRTLLHHAFNIRLSYVHPAIRSAFEIAYSPSILGSFSKPVINPDIDIIRMCNILISAGADVNAAKRNGVPPLYYSIIQHGKLDICKMLLRAGADINYRIIHYGQYCINPLQLACRHNRVEICKMLCSMGAVIDPPPYYCKYHKEYKTVSSPLHTASELGRIKICKILVKSGANVNVLDSEGNTPLHFACKMRREEICTLLCKAGANPYIKNKNGYDCYELVTLYVRKLAMRDRLNQCLSSYNNMTKRAVS